MEPVPAAFRSTAWEDAHGAINAWRWLGLVFPTATQAARHRLHTVLTAIPAGSAVNLTWQGLETASPVNTQYYHASSPHVVEKIREEGLRPSHGGAGSPNAPALYTSPLLSTCLRSYAVDCKFRFESAGDLVRSITVVYGIAGTVAGRLRRRRGNFQCWFRPGKYEITNVLFVVLSGEPAPEPGGKLASERARRLRRAAELNWLAVPESLKSFAAPAAKRKQRTLRGSLLKASRMARSKRRAARQKKVKKDKKRKAAASASEEAN